MMHLRRFILSMIFFEIQVIGKNVLDEHIYWILIFFNPLQ